MMNAHHHLISSEEAPITIRVGRGSSMFTEANMLWKVGITKIRRTATAITATDTITAG